MIEAIISGRVYSDSRQRNGKNGKPYATVKMWVCSDEGQQMFVNVIAFNDESFEVMRKLKKDDAVSIVGPLSIGTWQDKEGVIHPSIDLKAIKVTTLPKPYRNCNPQQNL